MLFYLFICLHLLRNERFYDFIVFIKNVLDKHETVIDNYIYNGDMIVYQSL